MKSKKTKKLEVMLILCMFILLVLTGYTFSKSLRLNEKIFDLYDKIEKVIDALNNARSNIEDTLFILGSKLEEFDNKNKKDIKYLSNQNKSLFKKIKNLEEEIKTLRHKINCKNEPNNKEK